MNQEMRQGSGPRVALVVGGSRGLGFAIAQDLVRRGAVVVIAARDAEELEVAREKLMAQRDRDRGPHSRARVVCAPVDARDEAALQRLVSWTEAEVGPIEVLFAVAGIIQVAPLESVTTEQFRECIKLMTLAPIHLALAALPHMRGRGRGRIGIVTSIGGMVSPPHLLPYATAKFGAVGFSDGLAAALAGTGVTCTTIVPGLMRTGGHEHAQFGGDPGAEYAWFAPAASLPILSADAERAARRFVTATLAGRPYVSITPLAWAAVRFRGLAPGLTTRLMGLVNRALPGGVSTETISGREADRQLDSEVVRTLATLGDAAARTYNSRSKVPEGTPSQGRD
ncbi:MAG: SDR family NAD(P)-dependent oxidoreductase [bacterium]|nr:SDR family NAD(P)-dependent oxidoreductase [bacterium]